MWNYLSNFLCALLIMSASAVYAQENYACEDDLIEVMFSKDSAVRLRSGTLIDLTDSGALNGLEEVLELTENHQWERITQVSEEEIDEMELRGELLTGKDIYNLNNIYRLRYNGDIDIWTLAEMLEELPGIISAIPVPLPQPLPQPPNYQGMQGYLKSASTTPTGIDAIYAWTQTGGDGTGVTVCDLEYSWNYNHNDLTKAPGSQINTYVQDPFGNNNHGTAVLGEMVSDYNGWGTTGICYGANVKTCGTYYGPSPTWNVAGAITVAISNLSAGDVILIEQQWEYVSSSNNYVPIEWWGSTSPAAQGYNAVYSAIQTAVANGIHVVEAGGNAVYGTGGVDMDLMTWFGDCGSIIVGAGGAWPGGTWPGGDLQRLFYSNYGSRFTSHGWGEDVVTTGYGTLYNSQGPNYYYASGFSGTSSASPIVAAAAADCVGYWVANGNPAVTLSPSMLRSILSNTGTLQIFPPSGNIGSRPNLTGAFAYLYTVGTGEPIEPSGSVVMNVNPNPASNYVNIELFTSSEQVSIESVYVYDLTGRQVADFSVSDIQGSELIVWDCRDNSGNSVPAGLYTALLNYDSDYAAVTFIVLDR